GGYPYEAVQEFKAIQESKRIFNHYTWGGYLVWKAPEHLIYIDGRMDNYQNGKLLQDFAEIESLSDGWKSRLESIDADLVLLPSSWPVVEEIQNEFDAAVISETQTATLLAVD